MLCQSFQRQPCRGKILPGELRARQSQQQSRIVLENALESALIDVDRSIVLAALEQFLGEPPARVNIAGNLDLGAGTAQIAVRVDDTLHARFCAARGSAAEGGRQDLHCDIGEGTDQRQQTDGQNPKHIPPRFDHMRDQAGLDGD